MRKSDTSIGEKIMLMASFIVVVLLTIDGVYMMPVQERWALLYTVINTVLFTVIWCNKDSLRNPNGKVQEGDS